MGYLYIAAVYFIVFWFLINTKGVTGELAVFWPIIFIKWFITAVVVVLFTGWRD